MAVACTCLVPVLPGIAMQFIDVIIAKNRPDLIIPTAATGVGAILVRQILFTLRTYFNNSLELKLTHLQRLPVKWFDSNDVPTSNRIILQFAADHPNFTTAYATARKIVHAGGGHAAPPVPAAPIPPEA